MPVLARHGRVRRGLVLAVAALALAGCQVRVGTDIAISEDGTGRIALTVALDEELATSLAADGFDPFAGLDGLPGGWQVERSRPNGGEAATVASDFDGPAELAARVSQLGEGIDDEDPIVLRDVEVAIAEDGSASFRGRAGLRPPSSTGLEGVGVTFDGQDLQALLEERGDQVMRVDLRVTMPGPVVDGNADEVDGATALWRLPVTELVDVEAVSDPPANRDWWIVGAAGVLGLAVGVAVVSVFRRRR